MGFRYNSTPVIPINLIVDESLVFLSFICETNDRIKKEEEKKNRAKKTVHQLCDFIWFCIPYEFFRKWAYLCFI